MADIYKAGLFYVQAGRLLLCRKKNPTSLLILPGGKLETGETAEGCLRRECREELGEIELYDVQHLGTYESPAAGDPNKTVEIELFTAEMRGNPQPHSEIKELIWFRRNDDEAQLAPSLRYVIFPDLRRRGLLE